MGPESYDADSTLADLVLVQSRGQGKLTHSISWYPPSVIVAIPASAFGTSAENISEVINTNANGVFAWSVPPEEVLYYLEGAPLPEEALAGDAVFIQRDGEAASILTFTTEVAASTLTSSFIALLNIDKELITAFEITAFAQ